MYKNPYFNIFKSLILRLFVTNIKDISEKSINKESDIGYPSPVCFSSLKYFVVFPLLMTQDSWFFKIVLIQPTKSMLNPNFRIKTWNKKQGLTESNAFSISTMTTKPDSASVFAIFEISEITLPLSLINLFLTRC